MTLHADLTALLAHAGIADVDLDEAVADEHVRCSAYLRVVSVVAAARRRDDDREVVSTILRDPAGSVAKTAVVALVDDIAMKTGDAAEFRHWAAGLMPEVDRLADGHREFLHRRVHDWTVYLALMAGRAPAAAELAGVTDWMQRKLATESTSPPVLALLAGTGRTRKIRNIAGNRTVANER
ncbi:hypothetical protein [Actinoallomurus iriomotensis]|uniref:Uncharacterized protein n=1 Tax=Actinoallomurus iriomotensis TaxID=478107 RepID=A0A9W6RF69_9ACTN|nr:hypothetical protein [Actinoallomurus iriomotensis]GLY72962.1 hypothetical protein Airi01_012290 [Actinoallomurus iriomotensis]